jgi:hypothetical protein
MWREGGLREGLRNRFRDGLRDGLLRILPVRRTWPAGSGRVVVTQPWVVIADRVPRGRRWARCWYRRPANSQLFVLLRLLLQQLPHLRSRTQSDQRHQKTEHLLFFVRVLFEK